jgi:ribosomal protein L29
MNDLYDRDFYAWSNEQAARLRAGDFSHADIAHIVEEIETLGRGEKRELVSRLTILLLHLLKWRFQPARRGASWKLPISNTRRRIADHLADNPSLRAKLPEALEKAYSYARDEAAIETGTDLDSFPPDCPWTFEQAMQDQL